MREIGIVKWFGGYNATKDRFNSFGFIQREGKPDLYVHRRHLPNGHTSLNEGEMVSFETTIFDRTGKEEAQNVRLFEHDDSSEVLDRASRSSNARFWHAAMRKFLKAGLIETAVDLARQKLSQVANYNERRTLIAEFPSSALSQYPALRTFLSPDHCIELYCSWLRQTPDMPLPAELRAEFAATARKASPNSCAALVDLIPVDVLHSFSTLRSLLSAERHIALVVQSIQNQTPLGGDQPEALLEELVKRLVGSSRQIWLGLPLDILLKPSVWAQAPNDVCIQALTIAITQGSAQPDELLNRYLLPLLSETIANQRARLIAPLRSWAIQQPEIISLLPPSDRADVYYEMLLESPANISTVPLDDLITALAGAGTSRHVQITRLLPEALFRLWPKLRAFLETDRHVDLCLDLLANEAANDNAQREELLDEIAAVLRPAGEASWQRLPITWLLDGRFWPLRSPDARFRLLAYHSRALVVLPEPIITERVLELLAEVSKDQQLAFIRPIQAWVQTREHIVKLLPLHTLSAAEQIDWAWTLLQSGSLITWNLLSRDAKILAVYRAAKENVFLPICKMPEVEPDPLVRAVLLALRMKDLRAAASAAEAQGKSDVEADSPKIDRDLTVQTAHAFSQMHELIENYIVEHAWSSTASLDLRPLLPPCRPIFNGLTHCEGRHWERFAGKAAYCPRAKVPCVFFASTPPLTEEASSLLDARYSGAHIQATPSYDWQKWSLLELLESACITPQLPGLYHSRDYVNKLAGYVNRLNEIRERLKCTACQNLMRPNYKYAKFLARYNVTVVSCDCGSIENQNVYLNHCWACEQIIDSRESRHQAGRLRICIHCGSGPRPPHKVNNTLGNYPPSFDIPRQVTKAAHPDDELTAATFAQGDICPKCGATGMGFQNNHQNRVCRKCSHQVKLPRGENLTGPICPTCRLGKTTLVTAETGESVRYCLNCKEPSHLGPKGQMDIRKYDRMHHP